MPERWRSGERTQCAERSLVSHAARRIGDPVTDAWAALGEELLLGLVHAANNRVTTLSAYAEIAGLEGDSLDPSLLRQEVMRLHKVTTMMGVLATRTSTSEALEVRVVLEQALALHAQHPRTGMTPCTITASGLLLPVRVPLFALLRILLLMVDSAKSVSAARNAPPAEVHLSGDEGEILISVSTLAPLAPPATSLARLCGGVLTCSENVAELRLPSLLALRASERQR